MAEFIKIIAYLGGTKTDEIKGLDSLEIDSSLISDNRSVVTAQPIITVNNLIFVGDAAKAVIAHEEGPIGLLEGMPLRLVGIDEVSSVQIFNGFLDFENYNQINPVEVSCDIKPVNSITSFDVVARNTYFNLLYIRGIYNQSDFVSCKYITQKVNKDAEAGTLALASFSLTIAAIQQGKALSKDIADVAAHTAGGVSGPIAGTIYAVAIALIDAVVFAKIVIETVKLGLEFAEIYVPPVLRHNVISEHELIEIAVNHLGYTFETNIVEMSNVHHMPGRIPEQNSISLGFPFPLTNALPKSGQPGETLGGFINIMLSKYTAEFAIIGNVVHLRSANDPFWELESNYILPNVGADEVTKINLDSERKVFNNKDFKASTVVSFTEDGTDEYTRINWKGTNLQVKREPINIDNERMLLYDDLEESKIPFSLATRKDTLDNVEQVVGNVLTQIDDLVKLFGGNSNLAGYINSRIGAMMISEKTFSNPKLIWLEKQGETFEIPLHHRELLSAKALYVKYGAHTSFVNTTPKLEIEESNESIIIYRDINPPNFGNQKRVFIDTVISFGLQDFIKVQNNSYFATSKGDRAKFEKNLWIARESNANVNYWIKEIWTTNIIEEFIEPI